MSVMLEWIASLRTRKNDRSREYGVVNRPYFSSEDGDMQDGEVSIAASTSKTIFNGAVDLFATASWLFIRSEYALAVELIYDSAATYGTRYQTYYVLGSGEAGEFGPPLALASTYAYANYTTAFAAGTLCYPDKILVKNLDTTNANVVEFVFGE